MPEEEFTVEDLNRASELISEENSLDTLDEEESKTREEVKAKTKQEAESNALSEKAANVLRELESRMTFLERTVPGFDMDKTTEFLKLHTEVYDEDVNETISSAYKKMTGKALVTDETLEDQMHEHFKNTAELVEAEQKENDAEQAAFNESMAPVMAETRLNAVKNKTVEDLPAKLHDFMIEIESKDNGEEGVN